MQTLQGYRVFGAKYQGQTKQKKKKNEMKNREREALYSLQTRMNVVAQAGVPSEEYNEHVILKIWKRQWPRGCVAKGRRYGAEVKSQFTKRTPVCLLVLHCDGDTSYFVNL